MSEAHHRSDLGPFPFAIEARRVIPSYPGWVARGRDRSFTLEYLPVQELVRKRTGEKTNVRLWIGRNGVSVYISFEFFRTSQAHLTCDILAEDFRNFLLANARTELDGFEISEGRTVLRVPNAITSTQTHFGDTERNLVTSFAEFLAKWLPLWEEQRLNRLLSPDRQPIVNAIDDLSIHKQTYEFLPETEKEQIVLSRIGQGQFRRSLIDYWGSCAVTQIRQEAVLRASHIRRWCDSDNIERLDPFNGLLLVAHIDALFDAMLISFADNGGILISQKLSDSDREKLGLRNDLRLQRVEGRHLPYLAHHRKVGKF